MGKTVKKQLAPKRKETTGQRRTALKNGKLGEFESLVEQLYIKEEEIAYNTINDTLSVLEINKDLYVRS